MNSTSILSGDILIVDDNPDNLRLLSKMLSRRGYEVRQALSGKVALQAIAVQPPDLILLDIMMPQMDGYEVCSLLKSNPTTALIPVIFLSALDDIDDKVKAFTVGGVDYITKPFQTEEVLVRVQNQLSLQIAKKRILALNAALEERVQERTQQLERANAQLLNMALYDGLTGLPNRVLFTQRLAEALAGAQKNPDYQFSVLFLDCDRFKVVNDSLGHTLGDELLVEIANRLKTVLDEQVDVIARFGGDEFAILLTHLREHQVSIQAAEMILNSLGASFKLREHQVYINASIGITFNQPHYSKPEHVLRDADAAMYRAKALGKGRYQIFKPEFHENAAKFLQIETDLRNGIKNQELQIKYQPIIALKTGKISGFEALISWNHPHKGLIPPSEFLSVAEETGLILEIGSWILQKACEQLVHWQTQQLIHSSLTMSVNLSARQFAQPNLISQIDQILAKTQLDSYCLRLEITESAIMDNLKIAPKILQELRDRNIKLSLDDFGTGYSSLSYLHSFPVDSVKIDQSFIQSLDESAQTFGLVPVIINIAHKMGMSVIAEGIETPQQLTQLKILHCNYGQGYFFSQPLSAEQVERLLTSSPQWEL